MKHRKLNILFRTSGGRADGKQLGLGHVYRCLNLANQLKSNKIFFLLEDYGGAEKIFLQNGFKNIYKLKPNTTVQSDIKNLIRSIHNKDIDILIVDKYNLSASYLKKLKNHTKIVVISDLRKIDYPADLIINGFIGFKNKITRNKYGAMCLLGPSFQILSKNFMKNIVRKKKNYDLIATFGGYDENNIIEILLKELLKLNHKIKTKVILGPATIKSKKISMLEKKIGKTLMIKKNTKNMHDEIDNAKYGICSGGITTYEFAALKVPFAIVCQVKHQIETAREWEKRKIAWNLGLANNKVHKKINYFLHSISEEKLSLNLKHKSIVDGLGAKRVFEQILKLK